LVTASGLVTVKLVGITLRILLTRPVMNALMVLIASAGT